MNYEKLKKDLVDYYGTAMFGGFPMALIEMSEIGKMSEEELLKLAKKLNFNLSKYE